MSSGARTPGGPEGSSQFWDDFWNTLYQFTHPFSSTFFDSLFFGIDDTDTQPPHAPDNAGPATGKQYFKDKASFNRFWQGLRKGVYHQESDPSTPLEHIQTAWADFKSASAGFISSVEWQQTWIQMILALHLIIFVIIILLRNKPHPLAAMLFCTLLLAALSEPLNSIGRRHWQLFSDDNYFDTHGVFTSLIWAAPLVANAILALLLLLRATYKMLWVLRKAQLQKTKHKKRK
ncbi:hypothetical protein BGX34_009122 [Mortierella sp. NVP85]|nr:hypothetical protein BGX34_009122 [Mortierella sp. NVP85]